MFAAAASPSKGKKEKAATPEQKKGEHVQGGPCLHLWADFVMRGGNR